MRGLVPRDYNTEYLSAAGTNFFFLDRAGMVYSLLVSPDRQYMLLAGGGDVAYPDATAKPTITYRE